MAAYSEQLPNGRVSLPMIEDLLVLAQSRPGTYRGPGSGLIAGFVAFALVVMFCASLASEAREIGWRNAIIQDSVFRFVISYVGILMIGLMVFILALWLF